MENQEENKETPRKTGSQTPNSSEQSDKDEEEKQPKIAQQKFEDSECREASHAGSWYSNRPNELNIQINVWLEMAKCDIQTIEKIKAIIAPHAYFSFSGPTASWAYKYVNKYLYGKKLRIFLMGPCHYVFIRACGLTTMKQYKTPIGNIDIDLKTIEELRNNGVVAFENTDKDAEEEEHSLEMHLPFIVKCLGVENIQLIPIMVGALDQTLAEQYGELFAKYVDQDDTLFICSTDFCHWGPKYKYTYYNKEDGEIQESIEKLDQKAMEFIESHEIDGFNQYLRETENNIDGRHAITILLYAFHHSKHQDIDTKFVRYAQSGLVKDKNDSSVSYAAAVSYLE